MIYAATTLLALAGSALASPVLAPRQTTVNPSGSPAQTSVASTTMISGMTSMNTASMMSSASSAISSAVSMASANTTAAPAPTGTPMTNGTNSNSTDVYAYGCPTGYSLTYVLGTNTYPNINITTAYKALFNWNVALPAPLMLVNQTGSGPGQARRTWSAQNITVSEMLTNETTNATTGFLAETWVTTAPINVSSSLIISNATDQLTLYANATSNVTTVQYYVNFCASSQPTGLTLYSELVSAYLTGLNGLFLNSTMTSNSTSSSSMMMSSMMPSSMMSSTTAAAGGVVSSGATGAASTAVSGASGAASTGISGASSIARTAVAGATSVGSVAASGVTSIAGVVTSAL